MTASTYLTVYRWGERDGEVMANPSVVATDMSVNWSEQTLMTTLTLECVKFSRKQYDNNK